jgi:predicted DsbA family dithiol-disulfide isomerase
MAETVEVFSDITCPFTHVGLERVIAAIAASGVDVDVHLRAWPLEWVNGAPLDRAAVEAKAAILTDRLGVHSFEGLEGVAWPATTIPALELTAAAYAIDPASGLAVGLALRAALFREGRDISDPAVLAAIAVEHGLDPPSRDLTSLGLQSLDRQSLDLGGDAATRRDYAEGQRRGVRGSPHYWAGDDDFFCPALVIGHDGDGPLTADFDPSGLTSFLTAAIGDAATRSSATGDSATDD